MILDKLWISENIPLRQAICEPWKVFWCAIHGSGTICPIISTVPFIKSHSVSGWPNAVRLRLCSTETSACSNLSGCRCTQPETLWAQRMETESCSLKAFLHEPPCRTCKKEQAGIKLQEYFRKPKSKQTYLKNYLISFFPFYSQCIFRPTHFLQFRAIVQLTFIYLVSPRAQRVIKGQSGFNTDLTPPLYLPCLTPMCTGFPLVW